MSKTNETTIKILDWLLSHKILAWRHNTSPIPLTRDGAHIGYRPAAKIGLPDIMGVLLGGRALEVEVKTGRDKLSLPQISFLSQASRQGALVLVVNSYEDFLEKFDKGLSTPV